MRSSAECSTSYARAATRWCSIRPSHVLTARHSSRRCHLKPQVAAADAVAAASAANTAAADARAASTDATSSDAKRALLAAVQYTRRGANTTKALRGEVEEAQVALESCQAESGLDYSLLEGKWRLVYTTAADVVPIVGLDLSSYLPAGLPAPVVGDVFQRFSSVEDGRVENIIEFGVPPLTQEREGITFTVGASYEVRSPRRIALTFLEAEVGQVKASPLLDTLLAPALLPRGWWNQYALLGLKEFSLKFPFRSAQQVAAGRAVGAGYLLTYLDGEVLIGRAQQPGGSFIFVRDASTQ